MRVYTVDVSAAESWADFITACNEGFIRQVGGEWDGNLDVFNDYLWWPDEHPYRLVIRGWESCASAVNKHLTWDRRPVLEVVAEIIRDNPQAELYWPNGDAVDPFDLTFTDPAHPFHVYHMEMALEEAAAADAEDEVPVGAVVVSPELGVVGKAHNMREQLTDPTAHAEMIALTQAAKAVGSWRLEKCILYATLEPCPMCAGAVVQARVPLVVYGCTDPKAGACHTLYQIPTDVRLNHRARVIGGVLADRCAGVLSAFFARKRALGKK